MKNFFLPVVLAFAFISLANAQEKTAPRTEFTVEISSTTLTATPGTSQEVTLTLNRSKGYAKSSATFGLSSGLPEGITVSFEPAEGVINETTAKIDIAATTKPGSYLLILKTTIQHKNKGTTLKLLVTEAGEAVTMNK